jgi:two-component system, cell cycle response regulator
MKPTQPPISPDLDNAIADDELAIARMTARTGAALAVLIVPVYHLIEFINGTDRNLLWQHAAWRAPVVAVAGITLVLWAVAPRGRGSRILLQALSLALTVMIFGMFTTAWLHPDGDPERMTRGLILTTFALALLTLKGGRELLAIYAAPFALSMITLWRAGIDLTTLGLILVDPLMMLVVAVLIAELFHRIRRHSALLRTELVRLASIDALTGLHNRRHLESRAGAEMARARRYETPFSVVIGDLDHFKRVNDQYGHNIGDVVLRRVAELMRHNLREEDLAVRWGGEEFLLLLPGVDEAGALQAAEKIRRILAETTLDCDGHEILVTISLGVAEYAGEDALQDVVKRADEAMYRAKQGGRNQVCAASA